MTNPDLADTHQRNWAEAQAACARANHREIWHRGYDQAVTDDQPDIRRAYRAGQRNGATVALVACLGLAMAAAWMRRSR